MSHVNIGSVVLRHSARMLPVITGTLAMVFITSVAVAKTRETLAFGIVPQQSATRLAQVWIPLLDELRKRTNIEFQFATAKDIPTFEVCLSKGSYDIAYMNPYHYTTFHGVSGYRAFARQRKKLLRGLIVVRKSDAARSLGDLNGERIAFPSPAAFGASVLPRAEMRAEGVTFTPVYVKSHDSVYRAVSAGMLRAGGGVLRTFGNVSAVVRDGLRVIYQTNAYTPHAFASHPNVEKATVDRIGDAMEQISSQSPKVLRPLGMIGLERAEDSDWNDVRALNLRHSETNILSKGLATCHSD